MLALCWSDVPGPYTDYQDKQDYQDKPLITDGYATYASFFAPDQHRAIEPRH